MAEGGRVHQYSGEDLLAQLDESLRLEKETLNHETPRCGYLGTDDTTTPKTAVHYERLGARMGLSGVELATFIATEERQERLASETTMTNLDRGRGVHTRVPVTVYPPQKVRTLRATSQ